MDVLLKAQGISKHFGGIQALSGVDFEIKKGEVHALVGENGAGKSTLMKIITGVYQKDEGEMWFDGKPVSPKSPMFCRDLGIGIVYQEPTMIKSLDVKTNIYLGRFPKKKATGFVDYKALREMAQKNLEQLDINIDPDTVVGQLTFGKRQMIEIAKVMSHDAKLVILDEPTSALSEEEKDSLFKIIRLLKEKGTAIIYISHRLPEIFEISDKISVLRDGCLVGTDDTANMDVDSLIKMMVGRALSLEIKRNNKLAEGDTEVLRVEGLSRGNVLKDINFSLKKGEILGISGLVGSGRTELARAIFGIDKIDSGAVYLHGKKTTIKSPEQAVQNDMGFVPESRKEQGIVPRMSIGNNITLTVLRQLTKYSFVDWARQKATASTFVEKLAIKLSNLSQPVISLSGGNQQKVVISKWLASNPKILILDEPTRGIDVGAKGEIHQLIMNLADEGLSVIMISSEMEEVMKLSDRALVLYEGKISGVLDRADITEENLLNYIHDHKNVG